MTAVERVCSVSKPSNRKRGETMAKFCVVIGDKDIGGVQRIFINEGDLFENEAEAVFDNFEDAYEYREMLFCEDENLIK